jgi:hypothetical protein
MTFVDRYWTIMDRLSLEALKGDVVSELAREDVRHVWAYLRLCEDQLDLRGQGWVCDRTWRLWITGMQEQLRTPPYASVLGQVIEESIASDRPGGRHFETLQDLIVHRQECAYDTFHRGVVRVAALRFLGKSRHAAAGASCTCGAVDREPARSGRRRSR